MEEPRIYVTEAQKDYWLATIPAVMGCNASGKTRDEAIANVRTSFRDFIALLESRSTDIEHWKRLDPSSFAVAEPVTAGLFPEDERPLEEHELRDFLHVFETEHAALMAMLASLPPDDIERQPDATTWSVREALEHMMTAQVALLSRWEKWPTDPFNTLQAVHRLVFQRFTVMDAEQARGTKIVRGRPWTVRRVMRRLLEHEWEHYGQIKQIIDALGRNPKA
jgi:uncharacterized damage-inducible protein DinB/predicted RNase H-like HicB family nuclease